MLGSKLLTPLVKSLLDRLGDFNPQLLRELKGRLKRLPLLVAIGLSLVLQLGILGMNALALPEPVQLSDLTLETYPQIAWGELGQLSLPERQAISSPESPQLTWDEVLNINPQLRQDVLPGGISLEDWLTSNVYIVHVHGKEPARGDKTVGLDALNNIQRGDRLIAIDGKPLELSSGDLSRVKKNFDFSTVPQLASEQMSVYRGRRLKPEEQALVGTTVELTLYRPELGQFTIKLPRVAIPQVDNFYCLDVDTQFTCSLTDDKSAYQINWPLWHGVVFEILTPLMVFPLMGIGVFLLMHNLSEEKRRGTLNFLQLSPRSPLTILGGKLLGVPICLYLAVALALPLHWFTGLSAGYGVGHLLGFDLTVVSQTLIFYLAAVVLSLSTANVMLSSLLPWLLAAGILIFQWIFFLWFQFGPNWIFSNTESISLFWSLLFSPFVSLGYLRSSLLSGDPSTSVNLALGIFRINFTEYTVLSLIHAFGWYILLGHGIQRRFGNPDITLLKRQFSYLLTLTFVAIMTGLTGTELETNGATTHLFFIICFTVVYCVALTVSLAPTRQTLSDWARFRQAQTTQRLPLWQDFLIGDTSSPVVAIAVNLFLLTLFLMGWILWSSSSFYSNLAETLILVGCILLLMGSIFFTVLVSQILVVWSRKKNWFWFTLISSISCLTFPGLTLLIAIVGYSDVSTPSPIGILGIPLTLLGTVTLVLFFVHTRQLILVGRSESQQLLQSAKVS